MKNLFFKSVLLLIISIAFISCSSDSNETPTPTPCPQGYTGANCSTQITPSRIKVNKIRVKYFPNNKPNGSDWDDGLLGNSISPDIFIRLGLGSGTNIGLIYESTVINNAISNGINNYDFIPTTNIYLNMPNQTHTIILGDLDDIGSNELMSGFSFNPYTSNNNFPPSILIQDNSIPLSFELFVTYEW